MLALSDGADKPCEDDDRMMQDEVAEVNRKIIDLVALRDELTQMLGFCEGERIGECRIVQSLGRSAAPLAAGGTPAL
jgi:hypothetical protein